MIWGILLGLGVFLFPLGGFVWRAPRTWVFAVPVLLLFHSFIFAGLACLGYESVPFGWWGLATYTVLAGFLSWTLLLLFLPRVPRSYGLKNRLPWFLGLTALVMLDLVAIYLRQGWGFDDGALISHAETYIRAPIHSDNFRNLFLIEALGRGDGSPFLAGSKLVYQLFWFHLATPLVVPLERALHLATSFQN